MIDYKDLVLQHTEKFLSLKYPLFKKKSHRMVVFNCPICGKPSCSYVNRSNFGYDFDCKSCNFVGNIVDLVRRTEKEFKDAKDSEIYTYIAKEIGLNITTDEEVDLLLNLYNRFGFDMVKIVRESKAPSEDDWVNKGHKDIDEWRAWLDDGLNIGVKCGVHSNIIIFDLDTKADECIINGVTHDLKVLKKILFDSATLVQETQNGWHFFYKYDERFTGTQNLRKYGLEAEIRSTGGQVVLFPSVVYDEKTQAMGLNRKFLGVDDDSIISVDIKNIPDELVEYLKTKSNGKFLQNGTSLTVDSEFPFESMESLTELLSGDDFASIGKGNRNHTLMSMGGMLRKNLNTKETERVLGIINTYFCHPSLDKREFTNIMRTLNKYSFFDKSIVAQKVLEYLKMINEGTERDIREALNYKKVELDNVLSMLVKEGYLYKKNRMYFIIKKADWKDCFGKEGEKIDFKMPYFEDVATFRKGDMILIGAKTGVGKTHVAMNMIKQLVTQNIKPYYISLESGSRFIKIANDLKLKDKDFFFDTIFSPEEVELEDNAVTIIDWLLPKDYAQVDKLYNYFAEQLTKKGGILIIFAQLKMDGLFFAQNMISLFPALVAKFDYIKDSNGNVDPTKSNFIVEKVREGKTPNSYVVIPCEYDFHSKELKIKV